MKLPAGLRGCRHVVLDTMFFIYLFEDTPGYADVCARVIQELEAGTFSGVITPVTAAEVLVKPIRANRLDLADRYRGILRSFPNTVCATISVETGSLAGALRAKHGLPLPDMLQAAVAMQFPAPALITNDKDLRRLTEVKVLLMDNFRK